MSIQLSRWVFTCQVQIGFRKKSRTETCTEMKSAHSGPYQRCCDSCKCRLPHIVLVPSMSKLCNSKNSVDFPAWISKNILNSFVFRWTQLPNVSKRHVSQAFPVTSQRRWTTRRHRHFRIDAQSQQLHEHPIVQGELISSTCRIFRGRNGVTLKSKAKLQYTIPTVAKNHLSWTKNVEAIFDHIIYISIYETLNSNVCLTPSQNGPFFDKQRQGKAGAWAARIGVDAVWGQGFAEALSVLTAQQPRHRWPRRRRSVPCLGGQILDQKFILKYVGK